MAEIMDTRARGEPWQILLRPAETNLTITQPTIDVLDLVSLLGFIGAALETGSLTLEGRTVIHRDSGRIERIIGEHGEKGYVVWPR